MIVRCRVESNPFEALLGPKKRFEDLALSKLFEYALTYATLLSSSVEVVRQRGGLQIGPLVPRCVMLSVLVSQIRQFCYLALSPDRCLSCVSR